MTRTPQPTAQDIRDLAAFLNHIRRDCWYDYGYVPEDAKDRERGGDLRRKSSADRYGRLKSIAFPWGRAGTTTS